MGWPHSRCGKVERNQLLGLKLGEKMKWGGRIYFLTVGLRSVTFVLWPIITWHTEKKIGQVTSLLSTIWTRIYLGSDYVLHKVRLELLLVSVFKATRGWACCHNMKLENKRHRACCLVFRWLLGLCVLSADENMRPNASFTTFFLDAYTVVIVSETGLCLYWGWSKCLPGRGIVLF